MIRRRLAFLFGLLLSPLAVQADEPAAPSLRSIQLIPFNDPWPEAAQRWRDIDNFRYSWEFMNSFTYANSKVTLTYNPEPKARYFSGHLEAAGLKPNFAYQIKLAGKPKFGSRGWGDWGDDRSNQALGSVARWWNDSDQTNTFDNYFRAYYQKASSVGRYTIYGYQFIGDFVTDSQGRASVDFSGNKAYHITWQNDQKGHRDVVAGIFQVGSETAPYYGYGIPVPNHPVKLWYEWQEGRKHDIVLPKGDYNLRLLISEESFHSDETVTPKGGRWMTVLATEDFVDGKPDTDPSNDVRFGIK